MPQTAHCIWRLPQDSLEIPATCLPLCALERDNSSYKTSVGVPASGVHSTQSCCVIMWRTFGRISTTTGAGLPCTIGQTCAQKMTVGKLET